MEQRVTDLETRVSVLEHKQQTDSQRLEERISNVEKTISIKIENNEQNLSVKIDNSINKLLSDVKLIISEMENTKNSANLKWIRAFLTSIMLAFIGLIINYFVL